MNAWRERVRDLLRPGPHLPGAGLLVGAAACVVFAVVSLPLPDATASAFTAALLSTIATLLLTGAANEEALARTVDRLGPQEGIATQALLAVGLAVATKVALLAVLASQSAGGVLAALLAAHAVSRFWTLCIDGAPPDRRGLAVASAWCLPALGLMLLAGGPAFVLVAVAASALAWWLLRRHGPDHADTAGATQQVCEVAFYLGAAFGLRG
ncbi:MAG TPA: adenosylcobinamide-GDP ribazoletransferase [Ramlibacter sp.]|jgi:adenosylcobinamide-GDP ribazoletransferase